MSHDLMTKSITLMLVGSYAEEMSRRWLYTCQMSHNQDAHGEDLQNGQSVHFTRYTCLKQLEDSVHDAEEV